MCRRRQNPADSPLRPARGVRRSHTPRALFRKESRMSATTSRADFEALLRRAQFSLTEAQIDDLYSAWPNIERMLDRLRNPARGREAEPAHIFRPEGA
jgi:hypothetical protein